MVMLIYGNAYLKFMADFKPFGLAAAALSATASVAFYRPPFVSFYLANFIRTIHYFSVLPASTIDL